MLTIKQITENTDAVIRGLEKKHFKGAKETIAQVIEVNDKRRNTQNQLDKNLAEVNSLSKTIGQLMKEGKKDKALAALEYAEKMIPSYNVPYDWANGAFQMAESYYQLGQNEKANKIIDELANKSLEYMIWYLSLNDNQLAIAGENFVYNASLLDAEVRLMEKYKSEKLAKHYSTQLYHLYNEYVTRMKGK